MIELERGWFMKLLDELYNTWDAMTENTWRTVRWVLLIVAGILLVNGLAGWVSDPRPTLTVSTVRTGAGTFRVRLYWRYQPGTFDSVRTSVGIDPNWSIQYQTKGRPYSAAYVRDSFDLTSTTPGVLITGQASVRTKKRGSDGIWRESAIVVKPWSYTEPIPVDTMPPAPPLLDSIKVSAVDVVPGAVTVYFTASQQFCAFLVFKTGQRALVGGQHGYLQCEQLEAALPPAQRATTAQYNVAVAYLSCVPVTGGKECRKADGSTITVAGTARDVRLLVRAT